MKKTTKLLAIILAVITLMSSMSIMAGAINGKSSAKELLDYYEDCIITTSAKEDIIKANTVHESREVADYSSLKGEDLELTKKDNEEWEIYTGEWDKYNSYVYFFCDKYEDLYVEGRSEFIDYFSIKRDIRRYELKFKSAKYSKAQNGDVTLTFVYLHETDFGTDTKTYTAVINSKGYLKSFKYKTAGTYEAESIEGNIYNVKYDSINTYKFVYNKVDAEAIEISERTIVLGKDEEYKLDVTVKPDNATFKDFYIDDFDMDWDVADWYTDENNEYVLYAAGPGKTTFNICTYSGDVVETVEVIVEYTFFERIIHFFETITWKIEELFDNIYYDILWFFEDLFYVEDFEDEFYEEEIYEEVTYVEDEFIVI